MSVMRVSEAATSPAPPAPPRVREQARAAFVVMAFSAGVSIATTAALLVATGLGR
ncbi:hypothetical protein HNR19_002582 [Nocardioides thalensis]|uniref:Uncharacterized protein n=1 Tax=Nocardioides thalensis TaxID=1914755 RepID=A0A853C3D8_9ACTN|nr:hypothetical protein [Nocardioides thalensis]NYJ01884.1 hypothetical protein [Nocardioides thalensis]